MNIYVGNLSYTLSDSDLRELFEEHGNVSSATVIVDKLNGRSKGFGFVEMPTDDEANKAIEKLNDSSHDGRNIQVNEARPREDRPRGGGGGGGQHGGGGGQRY